VGVRCFDSNPERGVSMLLRRVVLGSVVLAIVAAACGGGDLSLEEYFSKMDDLQTSFDQQGTALQTQVQGALQGVTDSEDQLTVFKGFLEDSLKATDDLVVKLKALDPPSEAQDAHDDFVAAGTAVRDGLEDVIDRYGEFGSIEEISQFFTTELADVEQQGTDACNALQKVADDNDIGVDLSCA
jgi:hypothetical protein